MTRDVRVIDSTGYMGGGVIRPDIEVMEIDGRGPYRRRWTGREPVVFLLILALIAIWMYRNYGGEVLGSRSGVWISGPRNAPPAEIETAPVVPPVAPVEELPTESAEPRPVITAEQQSEITGYSRVAAESLKLRAQPGFERQVIAILPRNREVAILRQSHITPNGDVWVEVMADTDYGSRKGWVMQQYLESCNCPGP